MEDHSGAFVQQQAPPPGGQMLKPHRGAVVLVLGILGLAVCLICGIIAWVMGNNDLREMDAGIMDPSEPNPKKTARTVCGSSMENSGSKSMLLLETSSWIPAEKLFLGSALVISSKTPLAIAGVNSFDERP